MKKQIAITVFSFFVLSFLFAGISEAATGKPSPSFFNKSWEAMAKSTRYQTVCQVTAGSLQITGPLTAGEKGAMEVFKNVLKHYRDREVNILKGKSMIFIEKERISGVPVFNMLALGQITAAEAQAMVPAATKLYGTIIVNGATIYYASSSQRSYTDKDTADYFLASALKSPPTSYLDKGSLKFQKWVGVGAARQAVYTGNDKLDDTQNLVKSLVSDDVLKQMKKGKAAIYIDERTGEWRKTEVTAMVITAKTKYQVNEVCQLKYGKSVDIKLPVGNITQVDADTGNQELADLLNSIP